MKKIKFILLLQLSIMWLNSISQSQLKRWYISPKSLDMTQAPPQVSPIPGAALNATQSYNGAYNRLNPNGSPMFYIRDGVVYNASNVVLGSLSAFVSGSRTSEISIVPCLDNDGCNQNKYFIIYAVYDGSSTSNLIHQIVDMNANNGAGSLSAETTILSMPWCEWPAIAVGLKHGGNTRNLYVVGGNAPINFGQSQKIWKIVIGTGNTFTVSTLFTATTEDFSSMELDINQDETLLAFACNNWGGQNANRYYIYQISNNTLTSFNMGTDNSEGVRGVEFYKKGSAEKLMIGAGSDGLYELDPINPTVNPWHVPNSNDLGLSQIEKAYNGFLYAGTPTNISAIDITANQTVLAPTYDIPTIAPYLGFGNPVRKWFYLPDQIDYENYDNEFRAFEPLDLFIKDNSLNPNDIGIESNPYSGPYWISPDIWVQNALANGAQPTSNGGTDEQLEWRQSTPNFIFVRIHNNSCVDYDPNNFQPNDLAQLYLNWAKANTTMPWPLDWDDVPTSLPWFAH
ncbi:MAG: hypothetical protein ABI729_10120, partial [Chitinophagales bacterium]